MFIFSIVMAVYNVEKYVAEAIESVVHQDFGFENNIQLILVDDGSEDNSGAICDEFKERYPNNICVIHQGNAGVSVARNQGKILATGKYINFLDSDDKLSLNTCSLVAQFFEEHGDEVDLVAIPLLFFEGRHGNHILNYKFNKGTRVIDLSDEYDCIQLSMSAAFSKREALAGIDFDTRLKYAEDAKVCLQLLNIKKKIGVLKEAKYWYRKRIGEIRSAVDNSAKNKSWYTEYLKYFVYDTFEYLNAKKMAIPKFIQYTIMYHLQWHFLTNISTIKEAIGDETKEYIQLLIGSLKYIEDIIILKQKNIYSEHKCALLCMKYDELPEIYYGHDDVAVCVENNLIGFFSDRVIKLETIQKLNDGFLVEGKVNFLRTKQPYLVEIFGLREDGESIKCELFKGKLLDKKFLQSHLLDEYIFSLKLTDEKAPRNITFYLKINGIKLKNQKISLGALFPIGPYFHSYVNIGKYILYFRNRHLIFRKADRKTLFAAEYNYYKVLLKSKKAGAKKAIVARLLQYIAKNFIKQDIWILSDRINKADDNGEVFFKYLKEHAKNIKPYFVIDKNCSDYQRLLPLGNILPYLGWKHKFIHLLASKIVSSSGDNYVYNPFFEQGKFYKDILMQQKRVFLQHGVTKDDISDWLNKYNKKLDLFITCAEAEYNSILQGDYYYDANVVKLTGFARFDRLIDKKEKVITIMPTWRLNLVQAGDYAHTGHDAYDPSFVKTKYFHFYNDLLNHPKLLACAKQAGYVIRFMPHPRIIPYIECFAKNEVVEFCNLNTKYHEIFAQSALVVTDYSSVAFDFAYLRKPVVYAQFDKEEFFDQHTYDQGYFDYERDGFGEVVYTLESTVDCLCEYISSDCQMKERYLQRMKGFFAYNDSKNCERIYHEILKLEE